MAKARKKGDKIPSRSLLLSFASLLISEFQEGEKLKIDGKPNKYGFFRAFL